MALTKIASATNEPPPTLIIAVPELAKKNLYKLNVKQISIHAWIVAPTTKNQCHPIPAIIPKYVAEQKPQTIPETKNQHGGYGF